jgi:hypothetical protein
MYGVNALQFTLEFSHFRSNVLNPSWGVYINQFLSHEVYDKIDVERFLSNRADYMNIQIPYNEHIMHSNHFSFFVSVISSPTNGKTLKIAS